MNFRSKVVAGYLLMLLGFGLLAHPNFQRQIRREQIEVGGQRPVLETNVVFSVPRVASIFLVLAGAYLVVVTRRSARGSRPRRLR